MGAKDEILPFSLLLLQVVTSAWLYMRTSSFSGLVLRSSALKIPPLSVSLAMLVSWSQQDTLDVNSTHLFFPLISFLNVGRKAPTEPSLSEPSNGVLVFLKLCSPTLADQQCLDDSVSCPSVFYMVSLSLKISNGTSVRYFFLGPNIIITTTTKISILKFYLLHSYFLCPMIF